MFGRKFIIFLLLQHLCLGGVFAERGIIVASSDAYARDLYASLMILRKSHGCTLPIEVWYSGDELSDSVIEKLARVQNITFHDLVDFYSGEAAEYRGYHIKGLMLFSTSFDELILMDADVFFFQDPEILLDHYLMVNNVAYFFRDREDFSFPDFDEHPRIYSDRYFSSSFTYKERKEFLLRLCPELCQSIPHDWRHYWSEEFNSLKFPMSSEHVDAGCFAIDKRRCTHGCELIKVYNENHKMFDKYILGDKETYWIALASCNTPFYVNPEHPYRIKTNGVIRDMIHLLEEKFFFMQKHPIEIDLENLKFRPTGRLGEKRILSKEELQQLQNLYSQYKHYIKEFDNA